MLSEQQTRAIELLTTGHSQKQTAQLVGVSTRALQRWAKRPEYAAALHAAQASTTDDLAGMDDRTFVRKTLRHIADDPKSGAGARVAALAAIERLIEGDPPTNDVMSEAEAVEEICDMVECAHALVAAADDYDPGAGEVDYDGVPLDGPPYLHAHPEQLARLRAALAGPTTDTNMIPAVTDGNNEENEEQEEDQ